MMAIDDDGDDGDDFGGGDTKAHYLPNYPRQPARPTIPELPRPPCRSRGCLAPLNSAGMCVVHFGDVFVRRDGALADPSLAPVPSPVPSPLPPVVSEAYALVEVAQPLEPPPAAARRPSIAEAFQDMLRTAYQAGTAGAASGETFEAWYERTVLR